VLDGFQLTDGLFFNIYIYIYIVDVLGTYVYMAPEVIRCERYVEIIWADSLISQINLINFKIHINAM
jgi:hypothetical protein